MICYQAKTKDRLEAETVAVSRIKYLYQKADARMFLFISNAFKNLFSLTLESLFLCLRVLDIMS